MKLKHFSSFSLVAAMLLVVSYPYFPSSEIGALVDDTVTISFFRGVLKGLGGGGGRSANTANPQAPPPLPRSGPISVPDFSTCQPGNFSDRIIPMNNCCPPVNTSPAVDFALLRPKSRNLRVRRALHLLDDEYMAKFARAIQLMRELPDNDPRSFTQQANVHCAYCGGGHRHVGFPDTMLDVHETWFFFAWHRMYTYFYERILGNLIDDPTFALPYWNWDSTEGMQIPESFADRNSTFYEEHRDKKHQPPATLDLNYDEITDSTASDQQLKKANLVTIYRQVVTAGATAELFHGKPYYPGDKPFPGVPSFEMVPHGSVHRWVGDRQNPGFEFMGASYVAARDPLFFVHHSNVDRIWTTWKTLPGENRADFTDPDWLNSEFMFYDEEARLVKMKVKDCLDLAKLGITYDDAGIAPPWASARPTPRVVDKEKTKKKKIIPTSNQMFPIKLDKVMRLVVPRQLTKPELNLRNNKEEVLVIQGIEVDGTDKTVKFDVIINDEGNEDGIGPANTEFAGSYRSKRGKRVESLRLGGISELLEGLGAQHDESVVVTLVPRYSPRAGTSVTIGGVMFDFFP